MCPFSVLPYMEADWKLNGKFCFQQQKEVMLTLADSARASTASLSIGQPLNELRKTTRKSSRARKKKVCGINCSILFAFHNVGEAMRDAQQIGKKSTPQD